LPKKIVASTKTDQNLFLQNQDIDKLFEPLVTAIINKAPLAEIEKKIAQLTPVFKESEILRQKAADISNGLLCGDAGLILYEGTGLSTAIHEMSHKLAAQMLYVDPDPKIYIQQWDNNNLPKDLLDFFPWLWNGLTNGGGYCSYYITTPRGGDPSNYVYNTNLNCWEPSTKDDNARDAFISISGSIPGLILNSALVIAGMKMLKKYPKTSYALLTAGLGAHAIASAYPLSTTIRACKPGGLENNRAECTGHDFDSFAFSMSKLTGISPNTIGIATGILFTLSVPFIALLTYLTNKSKPQNMIPKLYVIEEWLKDLNNNDDKEKKELYQKLHKAYLLKSDFYRTSKQNFQKQLQYVTKPIASCYQLFLNLYKPDLDISNVKQQFLIAFPDKNELIERFFQDLNNSSKPLSAKREAILSQLLRPMVKAAVDELDTVFINSKTAKENAIAETKFKLFLLRNLPKKEITETQQKILKQHHIKPTKTQKVLKTAGFLGMAFAFSVPLVSFLSRLVVPSLSAVAKVFSYLAPAFSLLNVFSSGYELRQDVKNKNIPKSAKVHSGLNFFTSIITTTALTLCVFVPGLNFIMIPALVAGSIGNIIFSYLRARSLRQDMQLKLALEKENFNFMLERLQAKKLKNPAFLTQNLLNKKSAKKYRRFDSDLIKWLKVIYNNKKLVSKKYPEIFQKLEEN
jgi:hypothetical protein